MLVGAHQAKTKDTTKHLQRAVAYDEISTLSGRTERNSTIPSVGNDPVLIMLPIATLGANP